MNEELKKKEKSSEITRKTHKKQKGRRGSGNDQPNAMRLETESKSHELCSLSSHLYIGHPTCAPTHISTRLHSSLKKNSPNIKPNILYHWAADSLGLVSLPWVCTFSHLLCDTHMSHSTCLAPRHDLKNHPQGDNYDRISCLPANLNPPDWLFLCGK